MSAGKGIGIALAIALAVTAGWTTMVWLGLGGEPEHAGIPAAPALTDAAIAARASRYTVQDSPRTTDKQILFGDLHVHSTFSGDAFLWSLPLLRGTGAHPPADACDFARYCSGVDFWSINDHAESLTPRRWEETRVAIEQCNAMTSESNPDLVSFLGWEWTQVGDTPANHYGHKNVILKNTAKEQVPTRPIAAGGTTYRSFRNSDLGLGRLLLPLADFTHRQRAYDFDQFTRESLALAECPPGPVRELPIDCIEKADTPRELFERLDEWGYEALVIPHGSSWGSTAPPGVSWDQQLAAGQHDGARQKLIEVYSGHGNSEEYRPWRSVETATDGSLQCPPAQEDFQPACARAGEIIRQRCLAEAGTDTIECEARAAQAREHYVAAGRDGVETVPGQNIDDWGDAGQCRDCFLPAFDYRPGKSAQYALAVRNFDSESEGEGFRFGLMASSDNHSARPGTGYKELAREAMTDQRAIAYPFLGKLLDGARGKPLAASRPLPERTTQGVGGAERMASFWLSGGLVAVHAQERNREGIWTALQNREVYGTSGPRILLWFDLLTAGDTETLPMGSATTLAGTPRFRATAVGARQQLPGCPAASAQGLGPQRLQSLCSGECYNPSDQRELISRIEVVRIRPQRYRGEPVVNLVEDPWQVFECDRDPAGCSVEFSDEDYTAASRDTVYYVRAIQAPTPAINGANLNCKRDNQGQCLQVRPCPGGYKTAENDDCLAPVEERAWSSPLFVDYPAN